MIPFLVYHKVVEGQPPDAHAVRRRAFLGHLSMLRSSGWTFLDPAEIGRRGGQAAVLTFDDATSDHISAVFPILEEQGIKAIFYVPTARLDQPGFLTSSEVRSLHESGHIVGSHSHHHRPLDGLPASEVRTELATSIEVLRDLIGERPIHFAPPGGRYTNETRAEASRLDLSFFRTMDWGNNRILDPSRIEAVPMTQRMGDLFLRVALSQSGGRAMGIAGRSKNGVSKAVGHRMTNSLRRLVLGRSRPAVSRSGAGK